MMLKKLKIVNFLSFVGKNDVDLSYYTAIMCRFDEGIKGFAAALMYVLNAPIAAFGCENLLQLYHPSLRTKASRNYPDIEVCVEISSDNYNVNRFTRKVINGEREEYFIDNNEVTYFEYGEQLMLMKYLDAPGMNMFYFTQSDFIDALTKPHGLEDVVSDFIGSKYFLSEIQNLKKDLNHLEKCEDIIREKRYTTIQKDQNVVKETVKKYLKVSKKILRNRSVDLQIDNGETPTTDSANASTIMEVDVMDAVDDITRKAGTSTKKTVQASSIAKLVKKEENFYSAMQLRRLDQAALSAEISYKEKVLNKCQSALVKKKLGQLTAEKSHKVELIQIAQNDVFQIATQLNQINDSIAITLCRLRRITQPPLVLSSYGRLIDYIKAGPLQWIVRLTLGALTDATLVTNIQAASNILAMLRDEEKNIVFEESFFLLDCVSPKIKDILFSEGERAISINNVTELQILFCKLKEYGLLDHVPTLIQTGGLPEDITVDAGVVVFIETGEWVSSDGLLGRIDNSGEEDIVGKQQLLDDLLSLREEEETLFDEVRKLIQIVHKSRHELIDLLNQIEEIHGQKRLPRTIYESPEHELSSIYDEYSNLFSAFEMSPSIPPRSPEDHIVPEIDSKEIDKLYDQLSVVESALEKHTQSWKCIQQDIRKILVTSLLENPVINKPYVELGAPANLSLLSYESQMNELKRIIKNDEAEYFDGCQEWNDYMIKKLTRSLKNATLEAKKANTELNHVVGGRMRSLHPAIKFCNEFLSKNIKKLLGPPLMDARIILDDDTHLRLLLTTENIVRDMQDCNIFIRTAAVTCVFVALACFKRRPLLLLDDLEEFFPRTNEDVPSALSVDGVDIPNARVLLGHRVGTFIKFLLKKQLEAKNGSGSGLLQIFFLTSDDLCASAQSQLFISRQMPPLNDDTEDCEVLQPISILRQAPSHANWASRT